MADSDKRHLGKQKKAKTGKANKSAVKGCGLEWAVKDMGYDEKEV
jgi:hypothetical protein